MYSEYRNFAECLLQDLLTYSTYKVDNDDSVEQLVHDTVNELGEYTWQIDDDKYIYADCSNFYKNLELQKMDEDGNLHVIKWIDLSNNLFTAIKQQKQLYDMKHLERVEDDDEESDDDNDQDREQDNDQYREQDNDQYREQDNDQYREQDKVPQSYQDSKPVNWIEAALNSTEEEVSPWWDS